MDVDDVLDAGVASELPAFHLPQTGASDPHAFDAAIEVDGTGGGGGGGGYGGYGADGDGASSADMYVPEVIQKFVAHFHAQLKARNVAEVHVIYESTFNRLTDRFFKASPWPPPDAIAPLVDEEPLFMMLYKELFYRHIYAKLQPTLDQRFESWENYGLLFDYVLAQPPPGEDGRTELELPPQWLWDIVDEYIYQFQDFCRWRSRLKTKTADEVEQLRENDQLYAASSVLRTLEQLVAQSGCLGAMVAEGACSAEAAATAARVAGGGAAKGVLGKADGAYAAAPLFRRLGTYALIGQLRMHTLLADYRRALQCAAPFDLGKRGGLHAKLTASHIGVCYYVGWCYILTRRYQDACRTLGAMLTLLQRTKGYLSRSSQYDGILKKNEQMHGALGITLALAPHLAVDDALASALGDKLGDKAARMARGEAGAFEDVFSFACPKFVSPCAPDYDDPLALESAHAEAYRLQLRLFLHEVRQRQQLPTVRSYLRLYSAIPTAKLAAFVDEDDAAFHAQLQLLKRKSVSRVWAGGAPLLGAVQPPSGGLNFFVSDGVVHVSHTPPTKRYGDVFIRQGAKYAQLAAQLAPTPPAQPPAHQPAGEAGAQAVPQPAA